jgi:hypothetical protein
MDTYEYKNKTKQKKQNKKNKNFLKSENHK